MGNITRTFRLAWFVCALTQCPRAQELRWQLPPLGAIEFKRQWSARSGTADSAAAARTAAPRQPVPDDYLPRLPPAPWLCQSELDARQQHVATPPRELREIVRAVALDLGERGSGTWRFARVPPFGDLVVSGSVGPVDGQGQQELKLTIDRRPAVPQSGEGKQVRAELAGICGRDASGTLVVRRRLDVGAGLVRSFAAELSLIVQEDKNRHLRLELREEWQVVAVRDNQDADFRARVAAAVRAGAQWVRKSIEGVDATFLLDQQEQRSFGSGRLALAVLTLLHAEVPADDPVVRGAFDVLKKRKFVDTYSAATALMALAQRHAPPREAEQVRSGSLQARTLRQLDPADQALATKWLQRILANRDTRVRADEALRFDYNGGGRYDNSLSQYALLGLDAAMLCGLPVDKTTWLAAGNHFLAVQCPAEGRAIELDLLTHRELALAAGGPVPVQARRCAPRGFAYQGPDEPAYGSLTAASVAGLVVARAGAILADTATKAQLAQLDRAIDEGFAWLAAEFTVRNNPGFVAHAYRHWYYWLYSLERACELAGIARLNGRDWYYEGALQLLAQQQQNGSFRADRGDTLLLESTCFAVLFLKKSTLPAITGR